MWALILHVFLMGYVFYVDELTRVSVRRVVNTQEIDALSTSHPHLTMTGFTVAQKEKNQDVFPTHT